MEPVDAHPFHHNEGYRFPCDGAREHAGGMERRGHMALGADGRFQVDYMAEKRRRLRESRSAAAAGPAAGKFDATVTPIMAWNHVATDIVDADATERVAKALANATTEFRAPRW